MAKAVKISVVAAGLLLGIAMMVIGTAFAFPAPLYPYEMRDGRFTVYSDQPIHENARSMLADVSERLAQSPLQSTEGPLGLYVANTWWRRQLVFWIVPPTAGAFVAPPFTRRHTFLSGADFEKGLLVKAPYGPIAPPRTLAYYAAHEFAHIETADRVGWLGFYQLPVFVREGLADYAAMKPSPSFETLYRDIGPDPHAPSARRAHGTYAPYRLLVSYFLDVRGWSVDRLLNSDLTYAEAQDLMTEDVRKDNRPYPAAATPRRSSSSADSAP